MDDQKITELTEEQKKQMDIHADKWIQIGLATGPSNRKKAEAAIQDAYRTVGLEPPPVFHWVLSPKAGYELAEKLVPGSGYSCCFGQADAHWLAFYTFFAEHLNVEKAKDVLPLAEAAKEVSWWWPYDEACIVSERPEEIHTRLVDNNRRVLHNETGPAVKFRDGYSAWEVEGVRVTEKVVTRDFNAQDIQNEQNAEVRRIMLRFYGEGKYIEEIGAKMVQEDKYGQLFRVEFSDDEPICMVRVVNATPEPDGTGNRIYFIEVPDGFETAHAAVAWTFHQTPETYDPLVET
jgi:hypothetical protein